MSTSQKPKALNKRVSIYLTADSDSIQSYFNRHDPSPIYSRQLSQEFELYLDKAISEIKRYSIVSYKITCGSKIDRLFTEPLLQAVKRHFQIRKAAKEVEFYKFKKRAYLLLGLSIVVILVLHGLLPLLFDKENHLYSIVSNYIDVFSWVVMWKPIERLIFYWNPFLKELSILNRLINAEAIVLANDEVLEEEVPFKPQLTKVQ